MAYLKVVVLLKKAILPKLVVQLKLLLHQVRQDLEQARTTHFKMIKSVADNMPAILVVRRKVSQTCGHLNIVSGILV